MSSEREREIVSKLPRMALATVLLDWSGHPGVDQLPPV